MKKGDFYLIAVILLLVTSLTLVNEWRKYSNESVQGVVSAKIMLDGEAYREVELTGKSELIEIRTPRGYDLLKVYNNGIQVIESDCPDKICMSYGLINKVGEAIICLPNRMIVEIIRGEESEPTIDAVST